MLNISAKSQYKLFNLTLIIGLMSSCGGGGGDSGTTNSSTQGSTGSGTQNGVIVQVASGSPSQKFMTLVSNKYNLNWSLVGDSAQISVFVADTAGNPVPDGTLVQFSTSAGQILNSCALTGITTSATSTTKISSCSVDFVVQSPLQAPSGTEVAQVIAWLKGQEAFNDTNGNGQYDAGESFFDSGVPFRDDNQNGIYDVGVDQLVIPSSSAAGTSSCTTSTVPVTYVPMSIPNTCDAKWGNGYVSAQVSMFQSSPRTMGITQVSGTSIISYSGLNKNLPPPAGAGFSVVNAPTGCTVAISPDLIPSAGFSGPITHSLIPKGCPAGSQVQIKLELLGFGSTSAIITL